MPKILFQNGLFASNTCGESLIQIINGANCRLDDGIFKNNDAPLYNPMLFKSVSVIIYTTTLRVVGDYIYYNSLHCNGTKIYL